MWAATVGGAAAVAVPYAGLGLPDIAWAGVAGGSIAVATLRCRDYRALRRVPVPLPSPPVQSLGQKLVPLVGPIVGPMLSAVVDRPSRISVARTSMAAPAAERLNRAAKALPALLDRLGPNAGNTAREALSAHAALRELAVRVAVVEKALPITPVASRDALTAARGELVGQLSAGVEAYERLTGAAAECVAALAKGGDRFAVARLNDAAESLSCLAQGLTELRQRNDELGLSG